MALMLSGLEEAVAIRQRMPRSCTMHFLRPPKPGPITVEATRRAGGTDAHLGQRALVQDGKLMGLALGAFSTAWESPLLNDAPMPDGRSAAGSRDERRSGIPDIVPPPFVERMVFQHRFGRAAVQRRGPRGGRRLARPARGAADRRRSRSRCLPTPGSRRHGRGCARLHPRRPSTSRSTSARRSRSRTVCCWAASAARLVRDGFFDEDGELWASDGTLIAQSRQLGLLIGAEA